MKKTILTLSASLVVIAFTTSCGGEKVDGAALAQEVCDCYSNANGLPADAPNRSEEQKKCGELQTTNWDKIKGDFEQEKAFNDKFPCGY